MGIYANDVQKLYIAYFNRPADPIGLAYWEEQITKNGGSAAAVANAFSASDEYKSLFAGKSSAQIVETIYQNLFGRSAEPAGITYWGLRLENGTFNVGNIATSILVGAQGDDKKVVDNKVVVAAAFTTALDTTAEILAYSGTAAASAARTFLATVGSTDASLTTAKAGVDAAITSIANTTVANGTTYTLTTGVDTITGTDNNDTINASHTGTSAVLGGLDSVDGGKGTDVLNIADTATAGTADYALPNGFTIKNIETLNITTNGAIGKGGTTDFDVSTISGLTTFKGVAAGTGSGTGSQIKAAATTDVSLTVAGSDTATISGGKAVSVTAGTGAVTVTGAALTNVTVTKGGSVTIDNTSSTGTTSVGTTLTAVTLGNDEAAAVKGAAVTTLNLSGQGAAGTARTITVTNGTANHSLTINANGTGYQNNAAATEKQTVVTEAVATATSATINTTAKSSLDLSGITTIKTVTLTGAGALTLKPMGSAVTAIQGYDATGNLTLGDLNAAAVTVTTGSGNDSLAVQATAKASVGTGAGNDTVTLKSALAAGSTITLGVGNDKLLFGTSGSVAVSTTTAVTSIDAGEGSDSVSANLITAGNAAQFKNFELVALDSTTGLDLALLTGSSIAGLTIDGASTSATYQNVTQGMGLTVNYVGDNSAVTNTLSFTGVTGTSDSYSIKFAADNSAAATAPTAANVKAGTVVAGGIEAFNIESGGTKAWNSLTLGADTAAKTVTITGAANLDLAFATNFGSTTSPNTGVSSIDGSAATGKLAIDVANVVAATAGITVKGGSAADTLTTSTFATTLTGGAGADSFVVAAAVTAGTSAPVITTITDAAAGDKIVLASKGTEVFASTKVDVGTATALFGGTTNALDLASTLDGSTNASIKWFQYGGNTYLIEDTAASTTAFAATDVVVKLVGLVDLSTASFDAASNTLTLG